MKLSDIKGEKALDVLAEMIEPATEILTDPDIKSAFENKETKLFSVVKMMIKRHKRAVIEMLAALDGEEPNDEYVNKIGLLTLPKKLMELLQDENLGAVLPLSDQMKESESSGLATVNTVENVQ